MDKRHSSPAKRALSARPSTSRKRSNSFPLVEALGCSRPEAELILAESRAAVHRRQPAARRGHSRASRDNGTTFQPRNHLQFLDQVSDPALSSNRDSQFQRIRHDRIPSDATDDSTSTVTGPAPTASRETLVSTSSTDTVLGSYSANLATFIQSQLNSIPSYKTIMSGLSPRSCPDFSLPPRTPPLPSPASSKSPKQPPEIAFVLEMPLVRPPLKSAFSAWSSTDDGEEEVPALPSASLDQAGSGSETSSPIPSTPDCHENANESSFLFSCTPGDNEHRRTIDGFDFFPAPSNSTSASTSSRSQTFSDVSPLSNSSAHFQPTSSAPSFSDFSTTSYFEYERVKRFSPDVKDRILAATAPHTIKAAQVFTARSPFEGGAIANVHNIMVESKHRVKVEGLSFDFSRDLNVPDESMRRVPTPC